MKRYLKLYQLMFTVSLMRMMQHRADFVFRAIPSTLAMLLSVFTIQFIFDQTPTISGWNRTDYLLLLGSYHVVQGLYFGLFIQNMSKIDKYIHHGELDLILLKPMDSQFAVSTRQRVDFGEAASITLGIILLVLGLQQQGQVPSLSQIVLYTVLIINAVVVAYSIWFITMTSLFWFGRIREMHEAFLSLFNINSYPISIFGPITRSVLTFVIPLAVMVYIPAAWLTRRASWPDLLWSGLAGIIFLSLSHRLWQRGLRSYTSASS